MPLPARLTRAAVLASCAAMGCLEVPAPPVTAWGARDLHVSEGVALESACTPSGVEICFDAYDNNCNGVIDEGCGLRTGILQFMIAWDEPEVDVDLNVNDATGELARPDTPTAGGLLKDRDCPHPEGDECYGQNVENVFLTEGDPPRGRYRVVVRLEKIASATPPVKVRLGARVGQRFYAMWVELAPGPDTEEKVFEFTL